MSERDPIEYLLNAMERAGQVASPAKCGYGDKRRAVLAAITTLRAERDAAFVENALLRRSLTMLTTQGAADAGQA